MACASINQYKGEKDGKPMVWNLLHTHNIFSLSVLVTKSSALLPLQYTFIWRWYFQGLFHSQVFCIYLSQGSLLFLLCD